jgi:hypothetical protein
MEKTFYLNRPIRIGRAIAAPDGSDLVKAFTFRLRAADEEHDHPQLIQSVARSVRDSEGRSPAADELTRYALDEGIRAAVRPFFRGMM